ncbi:MAG: GAF domain-containing protein [Paracoccaceae bacterium]|nr:GAF domain-containing protein [Paracoccaceae bacterium]
MGRRGSLTGAARITAADWLARLGEISTEAAGQPGTEEALAVLTRAARDLLGDRNAGARAGALMESERDYRVSGVFLIAPDRRHNVLVANQGFPPEQRRLSIPIAWNNPGQVVAKERFVLLENTDDHGEFRQFLKTSKMGSSIYFPIFAGGEMIGQIVAASQARWTYSKADVGPLSSIAGLAAVVWDKTGGAEWWASDHPAADAWYAEELA